MMGNCCGRKKRPERKIVLLLVGLDNAGKTKAANGLLGNRVPSPVPTVGFSVLNLKYLNHPVKIFDLGGGPNIRGIWNMYFVDAHGLIFVIDSSDVSRFDEVKNVLTDILYSDKISGKPILILANKQDNENAVDEVELIEYLNLEQLVNVRKCPTLVQTCSASIESQNKLDLGIQKGYNWIMGYIIRNYDALNDRVERDVYEQQIKEKEELLEKIKRIREQHALEERTQNDDTIETYSDYMKKMNGEAKSIPVENLVRKIDDSNSISSDSTSESEQFPSLYISSNEFTHLDRPRSAIELVKNQLKMKDNIQRPPKQKKNKTNPFHLYGARHPHSADERHRHQYFKETTEVSDRRHLKSADNALFTISNHVMGPGGDHIKMSVYKDDSKRHKHTNGDMSVIDI